MTSVSRGAPPGNDFLTDMPRHNCFQHQSYTTEPPRVTYRVLSDPQPCFPSDAAYEAKLVAACGQLRYADLAAVYLIHGTFAGDDPLGLLTELQRISPNLSERFRQLTKGCVDFVTGEAGNYTKQFTHLLERCLSGVAGRPIPVYRFQWSSQNNHIGRADGAVRTIVRLAELAESLPDGFAHSARVMLWGHSHGGNLLAIVTNLLAADSATRQRFFNAARAFYQTPFAGRIDMPAWCQAEQLLEDPDHPVRSLALDIVTFGTPIRYGWDTGGYSHLMHFVNHRPTRQLPEYRTRNPLHPLRLLFAADGDYVHQIGIAGTNFIPFPLAVRTLLAEMRLKRVLQSGLAWEWLLTKFARGQRVSNEATTLLVDYHDLSPSPWNMIGHAAYTRREWLPFHITEIAREFYCQT